MRELYFFNSTVTALMKKNRNKTRVVFNTELYRLQNKSPILFYNKISFLQSKRVTFQIGTLSNNFSSQLVRQKKNLMFGPCTVQGTALPSKKSFPFFNRSFDKKRLKMLFSWYYANRGEAATFSLVETLQKLGFTYAMKAGISLGVDDLKVPPTKRESLTEAVELLANTKASVNNGNVTALEEFQQFVDTWHRTSENLKTSVVQNFSRSSLNTLKKSNLSTFSTGMSEKTKAPLLDLRNIKSKDIKSSFLKRVVAKDQQRPRSYPYKKEKVFLNKTQDLFNVHSKLPSSNKEPYKQKQKALSSYSTILNPVYMMAFSGARGNLSQVRQLVGMRGLMADPQGQLVEFPIQSNFREGLTVTEYMISCYGARKGLVDTALRTAAAGYLTRRLVDVSHHQIVRFVTCSTKNGILLYNKHNKNEQNKDNLLPSAWKVSPYSSASLDLGVPDSRKSSKKRMAPPHQVSFAHPKPFEKKEKQDKPLVFCVGRVLARDIPGVAFRNQEIDISLASSPLLRKVYDTIGIYIRSPLTCKAETGICQLCYGWSVSANRLVGLGEAVGIIAAQSIGEPGTQLTMRTFHTGGVFSGDIMEECRAKHAGIVYFQNVYLGLLVRTAGGAIAFCLKTSAIFQIKGLGVGPSTTNEITTYTVSANTLLFVRQGEKVMIDSLLAQIPNLPTLEESSGESTKTIVSNLSGEVRQKATVNPELASIRILAGQECKKFYFFNSFGIQSILVKNKKHSTTPKYLQRQLICTNSLNNRAQMLESREQKELLAFQQSSLKDIKEEKKTKLSIFYSAAGEPLGQKLWLDYPINLARPTKKPSTKKHRALAKLGLGIEKSTSFFQNKKTKGLVSLIWGAHRLGNNKTFSININGSNSEVVLPLLSTSLQSSLLLNNRTNRDLAYTTDFANPVQQVPQVINIRKEKKRLTSTENVHYQAHSNCLEVGEFGKVNTGNLLKTALLVDLRFFIASKIHKNKLLAPILFKNSGDLVLSNNLTMLAKIKLCLAFPSQHTKISKLTCAMLIMHSQKPKQQPQSKNFGFFQLGVYKPKTVLRQKSYHTILTEPNIKSTKNFLYYGGLLAQETQVKPSIRFLKTYYAHAELFKLKDFFCYKAPRQIQGNIRKHFKNTRIHCLGHELVYNKMSFHKGFRSRTQLYKNTLKLINKKNNNSAIKKISILPVWPELIAPKMLDYAYLFWKLEDLIFFRSNFTKKITSFYQLRISINEHWWGNQKPANYLLCKKIILKKSKGLELINFLKESKKESLIKEFPNLILKLFSRFNIKENLTNRSLEPIKLQRQKQRTAFFSLLFNNFLTTSSKPRVKIQDSGEIFPLQGNTTLKDFQKEFRSYQNVTGLNSGLLTHYNRISYKIPLCNASTNTSLTNQGKKNNLILNKERLAFLRSELSVFALQSGPNTGQLWENDNKQDLQDKQSKLNPSLVGKTKQSKTIPIKTVIGKSTPVVASFAHLSRVSFSNQIGDFINTGDEIIKECASAYCGQIIEKSPVGLTLRLTQNILYSNLRNRPAKINKNVKNGNWIRKGAPLVTLPYISNVTGDIVAGIPKIEQLFEARGEALDETVEKIWASLKFSIVPRSKAVRECFKEIGLFVVAAIQKVYSSQGVHIADKHLEVIIRQMTRRALIIDPGDTEFLPEEFVDLNTIECVNWATYGDNAIYRPRLIGITKASLTSNSFLSSASFQQTARVLERETVLEKTDRLLGLKERVMMGALINAGTGELKTSVRLSDRSLAKSLSTKLFQRLSFFSRRKIEINKKKLINKK